MPAPGTAAISNAQYSSQDVYAGVVTGVADPPSGITALQRLAALNPPNFRIHAGTDGGLDAVNLPFNAAYTSSDGLHVAAWDFTHLNSMVANTVARTSGSTMLNVRYAPDNMFGGTGPMGGDGNAQGALLDQTYSTFGAYMANLVKYYNTSSPPAGAFPARPAGIGPIHYWEIWNEPDFSSENPRMPPTLSPPTGVILTGVNVSGGTLTPGTAYSYRITPVTSTNQEGLPSTAVAITLPAGMNAVHLAWNPSINLGRVAAAYGIYGRAGTVKQLVVVGKDNSAGLNWTDKGTITPAGGVPTGGDQTQGGPVFSPLEYKALWDVAVPAMKAVDPSIKVVGPAATNPISIGGQSVKTTAVTTGPNDTSNIDLRDFVQVLMTSTNAPDVVSYHGYGGYQGSGDSDSSLMAAIPQMASDVSSNIVPYVGNTPIWHTEANVNSADDGSRPATSFGAAWEASLFAKLAPIGVSTIHQYSYVQSATFGLITEPGSVVAGAVEGNPYLPYWVEYWLGQLFAPGARILTVANVPAGMDVLAVANPPDFSKVKVLVVNRQVPATSTAVPLQLAGALSSATRLRVIDSATNLVTGPALSDLGAVQSANLQLNGYSVALAEFDTGSGPVPPVVTSVNPNNGQAAGGTSVSITGIGFTGATSVHFGATAAASFTVNSDSHITATSPSGSGTVDVTVTTPAGTSTTSSADEFTYVAQSLFAVSTDQYHLTGSNGTTWQTIDAGKLSLSITPAANSTAILGGNADLWTASAGLNQDLAIAVSVNGGPNQVVGWKESGGRAGTFSPNAAFVQTVYPMTAATSYLFTLQWKTNIPEGSASIYAGAGPLGGNFSPTSLSLHTLPAGVNPYTAVSTQQYTLANSNGSTWQDMDATNLKLAITTVGASTAVVGGNADLWTANAGVNQDLGIFISGGAYGSGQLVAWKESGGYAGTFSPNAAFVQTAIPLAAATSYTIKLRWKSNIATTGTIFAAAGGGAPFSPTRLTAELIPSGANPYRAVSPTQYRLANSNGMAWQDMDASNLKVSITPGSDTFVLLGGNADLWTENATFNQDLAISVSTDGGPDVVIAWKESGGYAGTFSPNAAFVQDVLALSSGHSYVFKLKWKTNKGQPAGYGVRAGAGLGPAFSPTSLTAELISG